MSACVLARLQICHEFTRFSTYMPAVKVANFFGGIDIKKNREELKKEPPQIVVGTPGRIKQVRAPRRLAGQLCIFISLWAPDSRQLGRRA